MAAELLRPAKRTTPDIWARENRRYPETAGIPGPRNPALTPYMIPFARAAHSGLYRRCVAMTAAQSGKTDTVLDLIGARLDQRPAPILYVGPSKDFNTDQFEPRLMELFDEAESLSRKVLRGRGMKKTLKWVAGVRVRLAHAGSSTALKSDPAALALVDEYDEMVANIRGQGDPLGLVEARGDTYADFFTVVTSTPSRGIVEIERDPESGLEFWKIGDPEEIESPIWRLWQEGTRHHWAWPCPHCDEYFIPRYSCLSWPKGSTPAQARRLACLSCPRCGADIDESHKAEMNARGLMVAPGQKIVDGRVVGQERDSATYSQWSSGLASPFVTWGARAERLLTAKLSGEEDKIQTAMNAGFGELYSPGAGTGALDWEAVLKHRIPFRSGEVPRQVIRLVMGVDVQKNSLVYVIRGFGSRGSSWKVESGMLYGPTDEDAVWDDLADLMLTPIQGVQIEKVLIDSGFRPDKPEAGSEHRVYEFCRRYAFLVSPTKGLPTAATPYRVNKIEVKPSGKKAAYSLNLVLVNTDFFKSLVHSRLAIPLDRPGAFYLPQDATEDYARQIVSEVRVVTRGSKPTWVPRSKANHFLDCEALCAVAGYILNVQRIPEGVARDWGEAADAEMPPAAEEPDALEAHADAAPESAMPVPGQAFETRSIRNRFRGLSGRVNR